MRRSGHFGGLGRNLGTQIPFIVAVGAVLLNRRSMAGLSRIDGCYLRRTSITSLREAIAAADLILLDADEFIGHLEGTLGRVLRRKKPGPKNTIRYRVPGIPNPRRLEALVKS
jgi:hypothetical protein